MCNSKICEHNQLRRQCVYCELEDCYKKLDKYEELLKLFVYSTHPLSSDYIEAEGGTFVFTCQSCSKKWRVAELPRESSLIWCPFCQQLHYTDERVVHILEHLGA